MKIFYIYFWLKSFEAYRILDPYDLDLKPQNWCLINALVTTAAAFSSRLTSVFRIHIHLNRIRSKILILILIQKTPESGFGSGSETLVDMVVL